jgi:predicted permease
MRFAGLVGRERRERELAAELESHLALHIEENLRAGMTAEEARRQALVKLGGVEQAKELYREQRGVAWVENLWIDLRYAARTLRKSPGFTSVAILTLALGIGLNTALFSVANGFLLKTLPVRDPQQLVVLDWLGDKVPASLAETGESNPVDPRTGQQLTNVFSYATFRELQLHARAFTSVFALAPIGPVTVGWHGVGHIGEAVIASGNCYSGLGLHPFLGRLLLPRDDRAGAEPAAVISYQFWRKVFGGDPSVVGKAVSLDGVFFTVVGVTPRNFLGVQPIGFLSDPDVTIPLAQEPIINNRVLGGLLPPMTDPNHWGLQLMARLREGATEPQAQAEANGVFQRSLGPEWASVSKGRLPEIRLLPGAAGANILAGFALKPLTVLMVLAGLVLLIACANVANFFLSRTAARWREFTIRLTLGSGRFALFRRIVVEGVIIAFLGGIAGLFLSWWGTRLLLLLLPRIPLLNVGLNVAPDIRVFSFALAASLFSGVFCALAPAMRAARLEPAAELREASASGWSARGRGRNRLGKFLVGTQIALSLPLLVVCALFVRTSRNLSSTHLGFDPQGVLVFHLDPTLQGYEGAKLVRLYHELFERLNALPGVVSVSGSRNALIGDVMMGIASETIRVEGVQRSGRAAGVEVNNIAPGFFHTMGIPLISGRDFTNEDDLTAPLVAVVNEAAARKYFPNSSPVGKRFRWAGTRSWVEVVGIVGNAKYQTVRGVPQPAVYVPVWQSDRSAGGMYFEVRTGANVAGVGKGIYSTVRGLDPNLLVDDMETQTHQISSSLVVSGDRLFAQLTALFGSLGLLLSCVGLYGIGAYQLSLRTREIGIRVALGADQDQILRLTLRQGLSTALLGLAAGLLLALAATTLLRGALYGVAPYDPVDLAAVTLLLAVVAGLAAWLPARRAAKVDPAVALRQE